MHPHRSRFIRLAPLRAVKNGIDQYRYLRFIQAKIRHIRHRMPDRVRQLPASFPDSCSIQVNRQNIPAASADMAAATGKPVHQAFSLPGLCPVAEGETGIFPGEQTCMGNVFTL